MPNSFSDDRYNENCLRVYTLKRNFEMLSGNYEEVKKLIKISHNEDEFQKLWNGDVEQLDNLIYEFSRRMVNFLAMAKAITDVNRALLREWYGDTMVFIKYREEVKIKFTNNPLIAFTQEIRNYALHYRLPIANLKFPVFPYDEKKSDHFEFVLSSSKLLEWDNWTELAKSFIRRQGNSINVEAFIDAYYTLISEFYDFIFSVLQSNEE